MATKDLAAKAVATISLVAEFPTGDRAMHVVYVANADETDEKVARALTVAGSLAMTHSVPVRVCSHAAGVSAVLDTVSA
jgi:hypothetical protein